MQNQPVPMTRLELAQTLSDMLTRVLGGDSFEGSIEYLMPFPAIMDHKFNPGEDESTSCREVIDPNDTTLACGQPREDHYDVPMTTAAGEPADFMVKAAYRVGNTMGQGGMRMIGVLK